MTSRRRPKPQTERVVSISHNPGEMIQRPEPVGSLELRLSLLEGMFDLMAARLAIAESSLEAALIRINLLQSEANKDLLGL